MNLTDNRIQQIIDEHGGNFTVREFGNDRARLNPQLVEAVVRFRNWHGYSTLLTSVHRPQGAHALGAADMLLWKQWKTEQPDPSELWLLATTWPWWGVGIYFDWDDGVGLHGDICSPEQRNRPLRWMRARGVYYYQSTINGRFYSESGEEKTLEEEIKRYMEAA